MPDMIDLAKHGVRLFNGRLYNHDYLWFSSNEISRVSVTLPVLHNYALTYALSYYSYGIYVGSTPRYDEDLAQMPLYCTPADTSYASRTTITYNALDSLTLRTSTGFEKKVNTPMLGRRVYLDPVHEASTDRQSGQGYNFYTFTFHGRKPPSVTRLGKKGSPVRVVWNEIVKPRAEYRYGGTRPAHVINPRDVSGTLLQYIPISIPPHLLLSMVEIADDWFVEDKGRYIHLPIFVRQRVGS